jgi:hypothetical protein
LGLIALGILYSAYRSLTAILFLAAGLFLGAGLVISVWEVWSRRARMLAPSQDRWSERGGPGEAQQRDPTAGKLGNYSLPLDVPRGTRIDVHLEMPLFRIEEADAVLVWRGWQTAVQFEVCVPDVVESPNAIGRVRFAIAAVPVGTLRFQVTLMTSGAADVPAEFRDAQAARYRRAFASYASEDRGEVLRRVQAFTISGMSVFQDVLDLGPGERWERALYREIDRCDVFLLFWSKAAAASEWVLREIDYALARQGDDAQNPPAIQPVPIEGPPIVPPLPRLAGLHFNDALLPHIHSHRAGITQCENGHFYDTSKHSHCPRCPIPGLKDVSIPE